MPSALPLPLLLLLPSVEPELKAMVDFVLTLLVWMEGKSELAMKSRSADLIRMLVMIATSTFI